MQESYACVCGYMWIRGRCGIIVDACVDSPHYAFVNMCGYMWIRLNGDLHQCRNWCGFKAVVITSIFLSMMGG